MPEGYGHAYNQVPALGSGHPSSSTSSTVPPSASSSMSMPGGNNSSIAGNNSSASTPGFNSTLGLTSLNTTNATMNGNSSSNSTGGSWGFSEDMANTSATNARRWVTLQRYMVKRFLRMLGYDA